ncbi:hypothetical protein G3M48_000781 [Beauveria asiatica]|uniref:Uncharacterized protein n=1 Tax=Beauveria asiatica TaxID=1069075 RepID=A0AAW0RGP1_9HYPO
MAEQSDVTVAVPTHVDLIQRSLSFSAGTFSFPLALVLANSHSIALLVMLDWEHCSPSKAFGRIVTFCRLECQEHGMSPTDMGRAELHRDLAANALPQSMFITNMTSNGDDPTVRHPTCAGLLEPLF